MFLCVLYLIFLYCNIYKVIYVLKVWYKKDLVNWCVINKVLLFSEMYECIYGFGMVNCDFNIRVIDLQILGFYSCDSLVFKFLGGEEN